MKKQSGLRQRCSGGRAYNSTAAAALGGGEGEEEKLALPRPPRGGERARAPYLPRSSILFASRWWRRAALTASRAGKIRRKKELLVRSLFVGCATSSRLFAFPLKDPSLALILRGGGGGGAPIDFTTSDQIIEAPSLRRPSVRLRPFFLRSFLHTFTLARFLPDGRGRPFLLRSLSGRRRRPSIHRPDQTTTAAAPAVRPTSVRQAMCSHFFPNISSSAAAPPYEVKTSEARLVPPWTDHGTFER